MVVWRSHIFAARLFPFIVCAAVCERVQDNSTGGIQVRKTGHLSVTKLQQKSTGTGKKCHSQKCHLYCLDGECLDGACVGDLDTSLDLDSELQCMHKTCKANGEGSCEGSSPVERCILCLAMMFCQRMDESMWRDRIKEAVKKAMTREPERAFINVLRKINVIEAKTIFRKSLIRGDKELEKIDWQYTPDQD